MHNPEKLISGICKGELKKKKTPYQICFFKKKKKNTAKEFES